MEVEKAIHNWLESSDYDVETAAERYLNETRRALKWLRQDPRLRK